MTENECKRYEAMAKLDLPADERTWVSEQATMLEQRFSALDAIDTEGVMPLITPSPLKNIMREDTAHQMLTRAELFNCAFEQYDGYFQAPKTLE